MSLTTPLTGLSVLVLEDDFFIAEDVKESLAEAGASVVGPFAVAQDAFDQVERGAPDCALVDLNLGHGPCFEPARRLLRTGVPVILVTGYDHEVIPEGLAAAPCLQKPTQPHKIVAAVLDVCGRSRPAGRQEAAEPPV